MSEPSRSDAGFTLLEMVIAIMVMSIAMVAIVAGLASMLQLSGEHRGHAVVETSAHSFSQAIEAAAQFQTKLSSGVSSSATSLPVADSSLLKAGNYITVDRETMQVTGVGSGTATVTRGVNGSSTQESHAAGALVNRILRCPDVLEMTPPAGSYQTAAGVSPPTVTSVEYWDPATNSFQPTSASACTTAYDVVCRGDVLAECGTGLYRAAVALGTTGDSRLRNIASTTYVLVRTGGS